MDICRKQGEKRFSFCRDTELEEFKPETDIPPEIDKKDMVLLRLAAWAP